jgi:hypothetical protein
MHSDMPAASGAWLACAWHHHAEALQIQIRQFTDFKYANCHTFYSPIALFGTRQLTDSLLAKIPNSQVCYGVWG